MKLKPHILLALLLSCWFFAVAGLVPAGRAEASSPAAPEAPVWSRPGPHEVAVLLAAWQDGRRQRQVPVKIYYPADGAGPFPVIIFSHGLGGSREGYQYLGRHWASHGYVSVHLQHIGSDQAVWENSGCKLLSLRQAAAKLDNALNRPLDVTFAIDQLEVLNRSEGPLQGRLDLNRVGAAGHSFGAYTALAVAGEVLGRPGGREISLADPRIKAAIPMSAPVPRKRNLAQAFGKITIPCLHMTGTKDDSPIGDTKAGERRLPFDYTNGSDQYLVTFTDGDHMIFSDHQRLFDSGAHDARFHELIRLATTVFWDAYLKGDVAARDWLTGGGLAQALGGDGSLEMKIKNPAGAGILQSQ